MKTTHPRNCSPHLPTLSAQESYRYISCGARACQIQSVCVYVCACVRVWVCACVHVHARARACMCVSHKIAACAWARIRPQAPPGFSTSSANPASLASCSPCSAKDCRAALGTTKPPNYGLNGKMKKQLQGRSASGAAAQYGVKGRPGEAR